METLVPIEQWFRTLDRNLSSFGLKDGVNRDISTPPWLSSVTSSSHATTSAKAFTNTNERVRKTSILRQKPPDIDEVLAANSSPEKKNVRFADTLGGELEAIKYFIKSPKPVRRHTVTTAPDINDLQFCGRNRLMSHHLVPTNFTVPSLWSDFRGKLKSQSILFHSYTTSETTVYGIVAVIDHCFTKNVFIRYTFNDWNTSVEQMCTYLDGSHSNDTDMFQFNLYCTPNDFTQSSPNLFHPRLFFAFRYVTGDGSEYWDNNYGKNYCLNYITS